MWSSAQVLVNYGEALGTMVVAGALADWALTDRQRDWLADRSVQTWRWIGNARHRSLLDKFGGPQIQRTFLALVFLCEALLVWYLAKRVDYQGPNGAATAGDVFVAELLLFIAPLCLSAAVLITAGPRLVDLLTRSGHLPICAAKCFAAAFAADLLAYGALLVMDETFAVFGPRALLDWWDVRLWIYALEYAVSGAIVSAVMISNLLFAACTAAGIAILLVTLALLQVEILARTVKRYPRGSLLGSSIAVAGLAIVVKDWV